MRRRYLIIAREEQSPRFANMYGPDRNFIGHDPRLIRDQIVPRDVGYNKMRTAYLRRFRPR